ncbi:MAG: WD40 repeat domain-containing protein [Spirochaetaceae bacterium]|jgi:hypothetical protein|nr:WD40 repeat domain-containing protein [Spirochaetaceae bacterium]
MAKLKQHYRIVFWCFLFVLYAFCAARPVPQELVLNSKWLVSLETSHPAPDLTGEFHPFIMGDRFGYINSEGQFSILQQKKGLISISHARWAEYLAAPSSIDIKDPLNKTVQTLQNPNGYPFFLDDKIFIMHKEQNTVSRVNEDGNEIWRYDFASTITCVDAANGYFLAGLLDGTIDLLDENGRRAFFSEPSGSRLTAVYGCAIDAGGKKIAIISGRDDQRFVLIEYVGTIWRITYHEFLGDGLNRAVQVKFIDKGRRVAFEREDGIGIYDIAARTSTIVRLSGRIMSIDNDGANNLLFLIVEDAPEAKRLIAIGDDKQVLISAPFKSASNFLYRHGNDLYVGGGNTLSAFTIEIK